MLLTIIMSPRYWGTLNGINSNILLAWVGLSIFYYPLIAMLPFLYLYLNHIESKTRLINLYEKHKINRGKGYIVQTNRGIIQLLIPKSLFTKKKAILDTLLTLPGARIGNVNDSMYSVVELYVGISLKHYRFLDNLFKHLKQN